MDLQKQSISLSNSSFIFLQVHACKTLSEKQKKAPVFVCECYLSVRVVHLHHPSPNSHFHQPHHHHLIRKIAMAHDSPHVLISGAGLGGLTLAMALEKAKIPYTVLERAAKVKHLGKHALLSPSLSLSQTVSCRLDMFHTL